MADLNFERARSDALTPTWIKDLVMTPPIQDMTTEQLAGLLGITMALLDYARQHLPDQEWDYIHGQLVRRFSRV